MLGEVYLRQSLAGDALLEFRKSLELDPTNLQALQFLANYHLDNRAWADALPLLERASQVAPKDAGVRLSLGVAYRGEGRFDDARKSYEEALRLDGKNPEPHRNLAVLYGDYLKSYDQAVDAIEAYRKAGGGPAKELDDWVAAIRKDQKRSEDKKRRDAERKKRDEEEARAAAAAAAQQPALVPPPIEPVPVSAPAPEPASVPTPAPEPAPMPTLAPESAPNPTPAPAAPSNVWGDSGPAQPAPAAPVAPAEPAPAEPAPVPAEQNPWEGG
jgi:lipopolysaccharide biosynthesis regulator YciM